MAMCVWYATDECVGLRRFFLPSPQGFFQAAVEQLLSGYLLANILSTVARSLGGILLAFALGVPIGCLLGNQRFLYNIVRPALTFCRSVPTSMLFPLVIVFAGIGELGKIVVAAVGTFPMLVTVIADAMAGAFSAHDRLEYFEIQRSKLSLLTRILVPLFDGIPAIVAVFRICVSISLILIIVTEMFLTANSGLGFAAHQASLHFDVESVYLQVFVVGAVGVFFNSVCDNVIKVVERSGRE